MKVGILGGTRFIGPFIVRELVEKGHQVEVYHRGQTPGELPEGVGHVTVDRSIPGQTRAALEEHRPEAVIDMCGYRPGQVREVGEAGIDLKHYVFCSSTAVYGRIGKSTPDETTPLSAHSAYERGKAACEHLLLSLYYDQGFPVTLLRLAHPYGPGDELLYSTGRESLFLDRMRRGRVILVPGDGRTRIHPIFVEDAARAFVHVLGREDCLGRIYNLAGEEILTLDEYFTSIARVLEVPLVCRHVPVEWLDEHADLWAGKERNLGFAPNWCRYESAFDVAALRATGFRCRTDHDTGVAATVDWLEARGMIPASSDRDLEDVVIRRLDGDAG